MSDLSDFLEFSLLDHLTGQAVYPQPTGLFLALSTGATSDAGGITEVAGSGYAREALTMAPAISGPGTSDNTIAVSFTAAGGNFGNVIAVAIFDEAVGGNMLWHNNGFSDVTVNDGDTLEFAIGAVILTLA